MRSFSVIAGCFAAVLLVVGCGGNKSKKEATPSTPATSNIKHQKSPQSNTKLSGEAAQQQGTALLESHGPAIALRQLKQSLAKQPLGQVLESVGPQTLDYLPGNAAQKPAGTPLQKSQGAAPALRALSNQLRFAPTKEGNLHAAGPQTTTRLGGAAQALAGSLQSGVAEPSALSQLTQVVKQLFASPQRQSQIVETGAGFAGAATAPAGSLTQSVRPAPAFRGLGQTVAGVAGSEKAKRTSTPQSAGYLPGAAAEGTGATAQAASPNAVTRQLGQAVAERGLGPKKQASTQTVERLPGQAGQASPNSQTQSKPAAQVNLNSLRP